ncbi:MAG TPA: M28 family peptidase [Gemmatimonadaceae bacterium]|nr:M28 family peptidase [Gemmatimonadaceae bacterium]
MSTIARHSTTVLLALGAVAACGRPRVETAPNVYGVVGGAANSPAVITADELRRDLYVFASDSFGGRLTGTPYAAKAARFLTARLQALGVEAAGDSGYLQRVPLKRNTLIASELSVSGGQAPGKLALGTDLLFLSSFGAGALPRLSADGELAFAGYGIQDSTVHRMDFTGLDVAGKTVVLVAGAPPNADSLMRAKYGNIQNVFMRIGAVIQRQPAAIILLVHDTTFVVAQPQFARPQFESIDGAQATAYPVRNYPIVMIGRLSPGSPFLPSDWTTNDKSRQMPGTRFVARLSERSDTVMTHNVVGIVRGSDPARRNTYVAYGAHYDHIGIGEPAGANRDSINNGADDDGSGSVALLAIARAWAQGPKPPRSALFVWHIGEELGLFGSAWFTQHPTVPIDSIVAQVNADMIGRNHPDSLYVVGPGAAPNGQSRGLGAVLDSVNAHEPKPFVFNREWDTTTHPERIYYRSDHYNYAAKGIPIVFLTTGLHPQYHQVTDEAALIDYAKLSRIGMLMYDVGIELAKRQARPKTMPIQ